MYIYGYELIRIKCVCAPFCGDEPHAGGCLPQGRRWCVYINIFIYSYMYVFMYVYIRL